MTSSSITNSQRYRLVYCKYLKLTNGDNLIVTTDDNCASFDGKEFIYVMDPVKLQTIKLPRGSYIIESFLMEPWIRVAKDDLYSIPVKNIVVAADLKDNAIEYYQKYLSQSKETETTISSQSMEEMLEEEEQEDFENYLDEILTLDEEELEDGTNGSSDGKRTYH